MEEAAAVLARLERIEELQHARANAATMLDELRALLHEAEHWSRVEGGDAGRRAVAGLRVALSQQMDEDVAAA
jgi:Tfp pilus assembly protein PilN